MSVFIYTKKESALKGVFAKNTDFPGMAALSKHTAKDGDITYIDVSGLSGADLKKTITQIKKRCKNTPWGIIDPKGTVLDPAALFFDGASDYLGSSFFKNQKTIDPKRLKAASVWHPAAGGTGGDSKSAKDSGAAGLPKTGIKFPPANTFSGWKNVQTGIAMPFYLLYCSLQGKIALNSRMGEKTFSQVHQRFLAHLFANFQEGDGHLWMDSGKDCLFLLPPRAKSAEAAVKACVRMLISAPLITMETLALTIPANIVFALHYGLLSYSPPGKTGTVVSDAVNFVFHLGAKKSEPGRLTISDELPDGSIPQALENCFVSSGEFEGRKIWQTKKFSYAKPWV